MARAPASASATSARDHRAQQQRHRRRMIAVLATLAVVGGGAAGTWWWWEQRPSAAGAVAAPTYLAVTPGPYQVTVPAPGALRAVASTELRSESAGAVAWTAGLGDRVAAGDPVARLDPTDLDRDLRDAELALERSERALTATRADQVDVERNLTNAVTDAENRLERAGTAAADARAKLDLSGRLAAVGAVAPRELADAEAQAAAAREEVTAAERTLAGARADLAARRARFERDLADAVAAVEQARVKLERARDARTAAELRAPFAGVVSEVRIAGGGFAGSNAAILVVSDDRRLELVAQVDETEIGLVGVGQPASVTVLALGDRPVQASVVAVAPSARTSQNIPVFEIVLVLDNPDGVLRPGMTGEAEVVVRQEDGTVTLPSAAVARTPRGGGVVTVRTAEGAVERRQVEVLAAVGASLVVRGDLPAGIEVEIPPSGTVATTVARAPGAAPPGTLLPGLTAPTGTTPAPGSGGGMGRGTSGGGGGP